MAQQWSPYFIEPIYNKGNTIYVILKLLTSPHLAFTQHYYWWKKQKKGPWRCVAPWGVDPHRDSLELFGPKVPLKSSASCTCFFQDYRSMWCLVCLFVCLSLLLVSVRWSVRFVVPVGWDFLAPSMQLFSSVDLASWRKAQAEDCEPTEQKMISMQEPVVYGPWRFSGGRCSLNGVNSNI